ncbi:MAG: winged helix-turn-helix domain-containing protein [Bryobacterales bacterium]|nr:winged helix-turn-helix domain-containing protein [Bryobacterales bacterium]
MGTPSATPNRAVRFGDVQWDAAARVLTLRGQVIRLTWRTAECLHVLAEARGAVVSREEFHDRVWAGAVMEDSNLAHAIAAIRKALDPAPDGGSYVETVAKMGYRLAVAVTEEAEAGLQQIAPVEPGKITATGRAAWLHPLAVILLLASLGVAGTFWAMRATRLRQAEEKVSEAFPILRRGSLADRTAGRELLEAALRLVPNYPPARAGLAELASRFGKSPFTPAVEMAREAANDDPSCVECRAILGHLLMTRAWSWEDAGRYLKSAVEEEPQEDQWRIWYGQWLALMGRFDEAKVQAEKALSLTPARPHPHSLFASIYYLQGMLAEAEREAQASVILDPSYIPGPQWLSRIYLMKNDEVGFVRERCNSLINWEEQQGDSYFQNYGQKQLDVLAKSGRPALVKLLLDELGEGPPLDVHRYDRAVWQMWIGDRDAALAELEAGLESRPYNMIYTATDPVFAPLRDEPRFQEIVRKLGLAQVLQSKAGLPGSN